jgi:TetR/AcrR family transcriptional repressor of nem operon
MRYSQAHKSTTRARIVAAAAEAFRAQGLAGAGIADIMARVGLTHGGFYAHFASKAALAAASIEAGMAAMRAQLLHGLDKPLGVAALAQVVGRYLSRRHRDDTARGCPMPYLLGDVTRGTGPVRSAFTQSFSELVDELEVHVSEQPGMSARDGALALIAIMVGAMTLARAVNDAEVSERILRAARRFALAGLAAREDKP